MFLKLWVFDRGFCHRSKSNECVVFHLQLLGGPGAPSSFLLLAAMPGAPSSVLAPSSTAPSSVLGGTTCLVVRGAAFAVRKAPGVLGPQLFRLWLSRRERSVVHVSQRFLTHPVLTFAVCFAICFAIPFAELFVFLKSAQKEIDFAWPSLAYK